MKKRLFILISLLLIFNIVGCNNYDTIKQNQNISENQNKVNPIILKPDVNAAKIPISFYDSITKGHYDDAVKLLGPQLAFEGLPEYRKYLVNIENVVIKNFQDISNDYGTVDITPTERSYFAIKIYYADLDLKVKDKNLVPALATPQHRIFIVVKVTKDGPWLLDSDAECPARTISTTVP